MIRIVPSPSFKYEISDLTESIQAYKFPGEENLLKKVETYQAVFNCQYNMIWYPFDIQVCSMEIVTTYPMDMFMDLVPAELEYVGNNVVFSQYTVLGMYICPALVQGKMGVRVDFLLQRGLMSSTLTIFLPTMLVNIVGRKLYLVSRNT